MSDSNNSTETSGLFLLFLLFLGLKLGGVIDWSWWWVTAPLWGGFALVLVLFLVGGLLLGTAEILADRRRKKKLVKRRERILAERRERMLGGRLKP